MTEQFRPDVITPASPADVYRALGVAWKTLFGSSPERASLLVLLAQWALETGRGKACHCWNLGNIKHVPGDGHNFTYYRCNEIINGKEVWFDPPHPACCFRAYATIEDGATDYLRTLHRRFARAWPAVLTGDPAEFSKALKAARYYTADESLYTRAVVSLFSEFSRTIPEPPPTEEPKGREDDDQAIRALASAALQQAALQHLVREGDEQPSEEEPEPPDVA